jgi:hypothetical protein
VDNVNNVNNVNNANNANNANNVKEVVVREEDVVLLVEETNCSEENVNKKVDVATNAVLCAVLADTRNKFRNKSI